MKLTATSFFVLVLISQISSISAFDLIFSKNITLNESFDVEIRAEEYNYDVKIFVENQDKKIISQIYDEGWKNPHFYLKNSYPKKTIYQIKITEEADKYNLCSRIRKTNEKNYEEKCMQISPGLNQDQNDKIYLNTKDKKEIFVSSQHRFYSYLLITFIIFSLILTLLIFLKKL